VGSILPSGRLFIIDGAKALSKAIRQTFGRHTPIQRCQIHKACNIVERLPGHMHATVRKALRQAWEIDDAARAEQLIKNLARRLEREAPGVAASILEGLDETSRSRGSACCRSSGAHWPARTSSRT
jgi:putative transposase